MHTFVESKVGRAHVRDGGVRHVTMRGRIVVWWVHMNTVPAATSRSSLGTYLGTVLRVFLVMIDRSEDNK